MPNPGIIRQIAERIEELNPPEDLEEQIIAALGNEPEEE